MVWDCLFPGCVPGRRRERQRNKDDGNAAQANGDGDGDSDGDAPVQPARQRSRQRQRQGSGRIARLFSRRSSRRRVHPPPAEESQSSRRRSSPFLARADTAGRNERSSSATPSTSSHRASTSSSSDVAAATATQLLGSALFGALPFGTSGTGSHINSTHGGSSNNNANARSSSSSSAQEGTASGRGRPTSSRVVHGSDGGARVEINLPDSFQPPPNMNPAEALRRHILDALLMALVDHQELAAARFEAKRTALNLESACVQWRVSEIEGRYDRMRVHKNRHDDSAPSQQQLNELEEQLVLARLLSQVVDIQEKLLVARHENDATEERRLRNLARPLTDVLDLAKRGLVSEQRKSVERQLSIDRHHGFADATHAPTNIDKLQTTLRCQEFYVKCLERRGSERLPIRVRRSEVYEHFKEVVRTAQTGDLHSRLNISFMDEEGQDFGGVSREWFGILGRECVKAGLACGALKRAGENNSMLQFMPNPSPSAEVLDFSLTLGRIVGLALFHRKTVGIRLAHPLIKQTILGSTANLNDLKFVDESYHRSLQQLLDSTGADSLGLDFTATDRLPDGSFVTRPIVANGESKEVTDANKQEYVDALVQFQYAGGVRQQNAAFLRGYHEFISMGSLSGFAPAEVITLIAGDEDVAIGNWREETRYEGYEEDHRTVRWFWEIVTEMAPELRKDLLRFSTGSAHVPIEGFKGLQGANGTNRFTIAKAGDPEYLPVAHTCVNRVDIPEYTCKEELRTKLELAIRETEGFAIV